MGIGTHDFGAMAFVVVRFGNPRDCLQLALLLTTGRASGLLILSSTGYHLVSIYYSFSHNSLPIGRCGFLI